MGRENIKYATMGTRIVAFIWDYLIILSYLLLLFAVSFPMRPILIPLFSASALSAEITGFILITMPVYLYFAISEGSKSHATWGKRKMGIVIASAQGHPLGIRHSLLRSALKFLPWELAHFTIWHIFFPSGYPDYIIYLLFFAVYGLIFLYLISPMWSARKQTIYDSIAGTVVYYKFTDSHKF